MKQQLRPVLLHDTPDGIFVDDVGDHVMDVAVRIQTAVELLLHREDAQLRLIQQHQRSWLQREYLTAELRTDAAGGPGHQHSAVGDALPDAPHVEFGRLAPEQVRDGDVPDVQLVATFDDFIDGGNHVGFQPNPGAMREDLAYGLPGYGPRNQDVFRPRLADQFLPAQAAGKDRQPC